MGLLIISGFVHVKQIWPDGRGDADTANVELAPQGENPFVFVDEAGSRHPTQAFDNAKVLGPFGPKDVITQPKNSTVRKIRVRLQGVDAPELHYQPQIPGSAGFNHPFRQSLGETSANAFHAFLLSLGQATIPCEVLTAVSLPGDVCDVFGRVVGNLVLVNVGARIDVNHWLLREGWVVPGLYNSMLKQEIRAVLADYEAAVKGKRGLFSRKIVTTKLARFDPNRRGRPGFPSFKPFSDKGPVNFPKFFRRQAERHVLGAMGENIQVDLPRFIATKPDDVALETERFLKLKGVTIGKTPRPEFKQLATFVSRSRYPTGPEIVFWEKDATLVHADTKTEITSWDTA